MSYPNSGEGVFQDVYQDPFKIRLDPQWPQKSSFNMNDTLQREFEEFTRRRREEEEHLARMQMMYGENAPVKVSPNAKLGASKVKDLSDVSRAELERWWYELNEMVQSLNAGDDLSLSEIEEGLHELRDDMYNHLH